MSVIDKMKKRLSGSQRTPSYNVAAQVISYDTENNSAVVRPLGFESRFGESITVRLARTDKNRNSPDIHEMATGKEDSRMKTPVNGVLQLDGLRKAGDGYECNWISLLAKDPEKNKVYANVPVRISEVRNQKGEAVRDKRGSRLFAVDVYHSDTAEKVETLDAFKETLSRRFSGGEMGARGDNNGVAIGIIDKEGDLAIRVVHRVGYDRETEGPRSVEQAMNALFDRFEGEDKVAEVFEEGAAFEVFSTSRLFVGGKTAQEIEKSLKAGQSPRKVGVDRFVMGQSKSGADIYGTLTANLVTKKHDDGTEYVVQVRPVSAARPWPLQALNTPVVPEAAKAWFEAQKEAEAQKAAEADEPAADAAANAAEAVAEEEEIDADTAENLSSIVDAFDDEDEPVPA